eukprot:4023674-Prymnesium_polylepis.1
MAPTNGADGREGLQADEQGDGVEAEGGQLVEQRPLREAAARRARGAGRGGCGARWVWGAVGVGR